MKVKNRLLNFGDMIIYQDDECLVLLANFVTIKPTDKMIIDLCSGNAPIPMLLSLRTKARIFGVELQKDIFELGYDSILENKLDNQIELMNLDVLEIPKKIDAEVYDIVTCNPPYFKYNDSSLVNDNLSMTIARHEVCIKLDDIVRIAKYLLKNGGTFSLVHRPERIIEIINLLQKYGFEPKKMQLVYPKIEKDANMVLVEAVKNGKSGLKLLKPLIIYDENGKYYKNIKKLFGDDDDVAEELR